VQATGYGRTATADACYRKLGKALKTRDTWPTMGCTSYGRSQATMEVESEWKPSQRTYRLDIGQAGYGGIDDDPIWCDGPQVWLDAHGYFVAVKQ